MNRNIEGIRNTGSGDQDFEINRTRQEFAGIASSMQSAHERACSASSGFFNSVGY